MPQNCCRCLFEAHEHAQAANFASAQALSHYAPNIVLEPIHIDITVHVSDLVSKSARLRVTTTFQHSRVESVQKLQSITLNGLSFQDLKLETPGVSHIYDGQTIQLFWDTPFVTGEERKVTLSYTVVEPVAGLYFSGPDSLPQVKWAITDHETERARYWLACVDFPQIRTTLAWHITAPADLTSLANGSLVSEEIDDGLKTTHWKLDYRCPSYLTCFAVGEFVEYDDGEVQGIPIKYFAAKGYSPHDLHLTFDKTPKMIQWLQRKVDYQFPWPKYYQIVLPCIGGAMENISLVTWTDYLLVDKTFASEGKAIVDSVNIHELAHTYFGNLLVIRHFEHAWLKESWATYIESCWKEDNASIDDYRYAMYTNAKHYIAECRTYMRPIVCRKYDSSWDLFDQHTYPGGAWRLHMLRHIVGDVCFWSAVQRYVREHVHQAVETSDFRQALEAESGLNLTRFFDQWIYSKGYPRLKGDYDYSHDAGNRVRVALTQLQQDDSAGVPLFAFSIEVEVTDDTGRKYLQTVVFESEVRQSAVFFLPDGARPTRVRVDPEGKVLHSLDMSTNEELLENVARDGEDIASRIWAYGELVKIGTRGAIAKVGHLIKKEKFWGVRARVASTLANSKTAFTIDLLAALIDAETDPLAISSVIDAAHGVRDPAIRAATIKFLEREGKLPYKAHSAALAVLGSQKNSSDLEYLLSVAKDDTKLGMHGIVRSGALRALGSHRSEEAFQYLLTRVGYSVELVRSRPAAISALSGSADWQEKRFRNKAIEVLIDLLRDPNASVRMAAVSGLVSLEARGALSAITAVRSTLSVNEQQWLDRRLANLRGSGGEKSQREQVEKLEERVRKLESKLAEREAREKEEEERKRAVLG